MREKRFFSFALALYGLMLIMLAVATSCTKQTYAPTNVNFTIDLTASANAALSAPNGSIVQNGIVIIHTGANTFAALSNACTYQPCTVAYVPAYKEMICPCCSGAFDVNGYVVSGPPPAALTKYTTSVSGHILTVKS